MSIQSVALASNRAGRPELDEAEWNFRCKRCNKTWRALWPAPIVLSSLSKRLASESCPDCAQREIYLVVYADP